MTVNSTDNWNFVLNADMNEKEEWKRIKRNKRGTERGSFWGLDDYHVLYPVLYHPRSQGHMFFYWHLVWPW